MQYRGDEPASGGDYSGRRTGAHAVLLVDQAGWHLSHRLVIPQSITSVALPPNCPELNPVENIWQTVCSLQTGPTSHNFRTRNASAGVAGLRQGIIRAIR